MTNYKLSFQNVTKTFGRRLIFNNINHEFLSGNIYGISGKNGSGKSTLIKIAAGIISPTKGKVIHENKDFADLQQEFHYRFKKEKGYSDLEISQKRDALENVLIPETTEYHLKRLKDVGFNKIDIWFKWFNFASFICQK